MSILTNIWAVFHKPTPITKQIDLYVQWKAVRFPCKADSHERVLRKFFQAHRFRSIDEITPDCLQFYAAKFPSQWEKQQFVHVMRQFCRYWNWMGLLTREFTGLVRQDTILSVIYDNAPTMHTEQVERVQRLRREGNSFRQVKLLMETEDGKVYHLKQIQRWAKYELPKLSPVSPNGRRQ